MQGRSSGRRSRGGGDDKPLGLLYALFEIMLICVFSGRGS